MIEILAISLTLAAFAAWIARRSAKSKFGETKPAESADEPASVERCFEELNLARRPGSASPNPADVKPAEKEPSRSKLDAISDRMREETSIRT